MAMYFFQQPASKAASGPSDAVRIPNQKTPPIFFKIVTYVQRQSLTPALVPDSRMNMKLKFGFIRGAALITCTFIFLIALMVMKSKRRRPHYTLLPKNDRLK